MTTSGFLDLDRLVSTGSITRFYEFISMGKQRCSYFPARYIIAFNN